MLKIKEKKRKIINQLVYDSDEHHELNIEVEFWCERFDLNPECQIIRQNYIDSKRELRALHKKLFDELKSNGSRKLNFYYHNDINKLWKEVSRKRKSESKEKSEADFNEFYRNLFSNNIFHQEFEQHYERVDNTVQIKSIELENLIFENCFSFYDVEIAIDRLSTKKAIGNDDIASELIKYAKCEVVISILHLIYNAIFTRGLMPDNFNIALIITPIPKKDCVENDPST
jgi:hypothetical protein